MISTNQRADTITLSIQAASLAALGMIVVVGALVVLGTAYLPQAIDWHKHFVPSVRALAQGESPYRASGHVYNPPWILAALLPFAADEAAGRAALFLIAITVYAWTAYRFGAKPLSMALFLLSPPILHTLLNGNLEWMVFIGLLLPPRWGLFLVVAKPQVGAGVALLWIWDAWRGERWAGLLSLLAPVTLALLLSFAIYGFWPGAARQTLDAAWNAALWPHLVPVGVGLLALALRRRSMHLALLAAPMLSPYVALHSWSGALLAGVHDQKIILLVFVALWAIAGFVAIA